ncbi:MAG: hypothetical protein K2G04_09440 [Oscillospiraceae bacterium]|nr:hypothetical protein [Oscillospiraceae bacterium]
MVYLVPFLEFILSVKNMWILLAVLMAICIADLFKRHLLSNTAVYSVTMLIVPTALAAAVGAFFASFGGTSIGKIILDIIGCLALFAVAATVYVRGNIFPVDKSKTEKSPYLDTVALYSARKLIAVGLAGNVLYGVLMLISVAEIIMLIGTFVTSGTIMFLPFLLLLLFVPLLNIFVICLFLLIGAEFVVLGVTAFMTLLPVIMIANGCIRYILTTDKTKGKKVLWILLSLIPVVNFVYGIYCIVQINKSLKGGY